MTGQLLIKETQLQRIIRKTGRKPCECKCSLCRMQCHTPCLGTPQDIERLIDAGYADRLAPTLWGAGIIMGVIDIPIPMIQAVAGDEYCIFYHNGLCELHDKGLKPTEGRLSHHSTRLDNFKCRAILRARPWPLGQQGYRPYSRSLCPRQNPVSSRQWCWEPEGPSARPWPSAWCREVR